MHTGVAFFPYLGNFVIFSYFKGVVCLQLHGDPDVVLSVYSCLVILMWYCLFTVAWLPWCGVVCLQLPGYPDVVLSVYSCLVTLMWCCLGEDPAVWHTERMPSRPSSPTMRQYGRGPSTPGKETQSNGRQHRKSEVEIIFELLWLPVVCLSVFFFTFLTFAQVLLDQF